MSTNKKIKTTTTTTNNNNNNDNDNRIHEEFEQVKKYLLECPHVPSNHPAIKAALIAMDKEQQRMDRDRKLQLKFSQQGKETITAMTKTTTTTTMMMMEKNVLDDSVVVVSSPPTRTEELSADEEEMEWQDVEEEDHKEKESVDDQTSYLGKTLAKIAIDTIAEYKTTLKSPVAAIALALHAALRSDLLGFSCTGVPEDDSVSKGGFAPPVRELPKTQFLPTSWKENHSDSSTSNIAFRYRKAGTGAILLRVEESDDHQTVTVRLQPASNKEPSSQTLTFSLGDHINLDSWHAVRKTTSLVSPTLHYKSLALLLTNFCRTFDLGAIHEDNEDEDDTMMKERVAAVSPSITNVDITTLPPSIQKSDFIPTIPVPIPPTGASQQPPPRYRGNEFPTTLDEAFPGIQPPRPRGDFAGDLAPAGLIDPRFYPSNNNGRMGGNLMGPNHPMFLGGGGIPMGGPGSMQPRFDPIYPEGIDFPNGVPPGRKANRPSRSGEPNPDHLPPPNAFGDDMFS